MPKVRNSNFEKYSENERENLCKPDALKYFNKHFNF